jgi:HEAT repeat protein
MPVMTAIHDFNPGLARGTIQRLIQQLNVLHNGDLAVEKLVIFGQQAIGPLREYLINGTPSHIYQPRQRAVHALARLGAKDVLLEYLNVPKDIPDPVIRFGEEAVENTAARALAAWQIDEIFEKLLQIARERIFPGLIEALGSFSRSEAIPLFIAALMDDFSRTAAENVLKAMGDMAKPALIEAVHTSPDSSENGESPSNLLRRRSAMRILADLTVTVDEWSRLKEFLTNDDPEISASVAGIALEIADPEDRRAAIDILIAKVPYVNWCIQKEIENCLAKHYNIALRQIADQTTQRRMQPEKVQAEDRVLQILLNVQRQAEGGCLSTNQDGLI